jgi:hypothetical protein
LTLDLRKQERPDAAHAAEHAFAIDGDAPFDQRVVGVRQRRKLGGPALLTNESAPTKAVSPVR